MKENAIEELVDSLENMKENLNTPVNYSAIKSLSPSNNLMATLIAMGTPQHIAYEQAIHRYNPVYNSKTERSKKADATNYLKKNPALCEAINEYKNSFMSQYTQTLQLNKNKILAQIDSLATLATQNQDIKTALECLKTIGTELGMFQKNMTVQHTIHKPNTQIIEIVQRNVPKLD